MTAFNSGAITSLVSGFSIEVTPTTAAKVENFGTVLQKGTRVNVTFLPGSDRNETISCSRRLTDEGMVPVPHVAVRSLEGKEATDTYLKRLMDEAGVTEILLIGGEVDDPKGEFHDTVQVLKAGLIAGRGLKRVNVAGHPEGNPRIGYDKSMDFLKAKADFARDNGVEMALITQFVFEAEPVLKWIADMKAKGLDLPVAIGIPGPAKIQTLLNYAKACGIGPSIKFIMRQAKNVAKLMTVNQPDTLLIDLAAAKLDGRADLIERTHFYPFGGVAKTAEWANAVAQGRFSEAKKGRNFSVDESVALRAAS